MKRHSSLVPLSREHHDGLVMAQRLILGRATNPRAVWPLEPERQLDRLIYFFESDLCWHFEFEEVHVFPLVRKQLTDGEQWSAKLVEDHDLMRTMIKEFQIGQTMYLGKRLPAFGEQLKAHIHREERELFEQMQAECTSGQFAELGARIDEYVAVKSVSSCGL